VPPHFGYGVSKPLVIFKIEFGCCGPQLFFPAVDFSLTRLRSEVYDQLGSL
jgi:hypothetical protein